MTIPIFLATDKNYIIPAIVLISSVLENTNENCNFYILNANLDEQEQQYFHKCLSKYNNFSLEFIKIDSNTFSKYPINRHITIATYYRFLISDLKPELDKALYLDVDMVVNFDIKELFEINLDGKPIAAVSEKCMDYMERYSTYCQTVLDIDPVKYFNAGMLLLNLKYFRENDIITKLFETLEEYKDKITCNDQCILNLVFKNNYKQLEYKYNCGTPLKKLLEDNNDKDISAFDDIKIYHFMGEAKPWNSKSNFDDIWLKKAGKVISSKELKFFCRERYKNRMKPLEYIFSIKNEIKDYRKRKVLTILGIKFKFTPVSLKSVGGGQI